MEELQTFGGTHGCTRKESVSPVKVTSAVRLTDDQKSKIIEKMKVKCETDSIKLIEEIDGNLISGFKLEWGYIDPVNLDAPSHGVDLSLQNILNKKALQVCLPNSAALRGSELFAGAASAASFGAGLAMSVDFWSKTMLSNSVSCAKRSSSGEVAIVLLTCADAELAPRLAELALRE
eukprot:s4607_g2.t1